MCADRAVGAAANRSFPARAERAEADSAGETAHRYVHVGRRTRFPSVHAGLRPAVPTGGVSASASAVRVAEPLRPRYNTKEYRYARGMTEATEPVGTVLGLCYGRVSTREQAEAGHGLAAQRKRAETYCGLMGIAPTEWIADQGRTGSLAPDKRPGLARALAMLAAGDADALVVPALDRLARSTRDVLDVADRAQAQQWRLAVVGLMDSGTPEGRAVLTVMAAMAELERGLISRRTTEALRAARRSGVRLGRPPSTHTRAAGRRVAELRAQGHPWRAIPALLDAEQYPRADGELRPWNLRACRDAHTTIELDNQASAASMRSSRE